MSTIKIGKITLSKNQDNGTINASVFEANQEEFESTLGDLLEWLQLLKFDKIIFKAGGSLILPDWFMQKCKQAGIDVEIMERAVIIDVPKKKLYIWKLGVFLHSNNMVMSGEELADHLNRNNFLTSNGAKYQGGRGTYKLIKETWRWVNDELVLQDDASKIAEAFVKPDGSFAYE